MHLLNGPLRMGDNEVTIIVPVLDRVHTLEPLVQSINDNTEKPYIIFVRSPGRPEVREELQRIFFKYDNTEYRKRQITPQIGDYASKINMCVGWIFTDWFLCGADDLRFHPNWFENAMKFDAPGINVIGTQDLGNPRVLRGRHSTHCLVRTSYARDEGLTVDQKPGEVLSPRYWHEYCDDELVGVAQHRKIWAFANDSVVEHMHPHWGKAETDASYNQQEMRMTFSRSLYLSRKSLWT